MTIPTLVEQLRALARCEHGDMTLGDDAADEIERLQAELVVATARKLSAQSALSVAERRATAQQIDPAAWYDSKSGQVDFGSWMPTRKPSAPDAEWLPFYSAPAQPPRELTDEAIWRNDEIMAINARAGLQMPVLMELCRAIERLVRGTPE